MQTRRCIHGGWPHSCSRCGDIERMLDEISAHDIRYWYGTAYLFLEQLLASEKRRVELEREVRRLQKEQANRGCLPDATEKGEGS